MALNDFKKQNQRKKQSDVLTIQPTDGWTDRQSGVSSCVHATRKAGAEHLLKRGNNNLEDGQAGAYNPIHTQKDKHKRNISNVRFHSFDSIIMDGRTDTMDNFQLHATRLYTQRNQTVCPSVRLSVSAGLILKRARKPDALCLAPMKSLPTLGVIQKYARSQPRMIPSCILAPL